MKTRTFKRTISIFIALLIILGTIPAVSYAGTATDLEWWNFRNNEENNGVTDRPAITDPNFASLKWGVKYGTGWGAAPTPPLIIDGYLYIGTGNTIKKIDKNTGECVQTSGAMVANVGYAMNPIVYGDGKFFVQVGNGMVQAVDFETLEPLWHTEKIGGQTVSPITYKEINGQGYIYTGTWSAERKNGTYLCATTDNENVTDDNNGKDGGVKSLTWTFIPSEDDEALEGTENNTRGFYWAGAYATDNYVAFGSDDGTSEGDYTANGVFYTVNPLTGDIIDRIDGIKGDIRSTIVYNEGCLFFTTKGGLLYRVEVDENGNLTNASYMDLGGMATASPLVHNGRIYVGVCGQGGQFDPDGGHHFSVVDASQELSSNSLIYDIPIKGYPQAAALMSTSEEDKDFNGDGTADGRVYIYFTYNSNPGGIYYIYDEPGMTEASSEQGELFVPPTGMQQYCISTLCMDRDGTLYYKNDSCYLMAVERNLAYVENATIATDAGDVKWNASFTAGTTEYEVKVPTASTVGKITLNLPEGVTATVNGEDYAGENHEIALSADSDTTAVKVVAQYEDKTRTYTINLVKESSVSTLSELRVNGSNAYTGSIVGITPTFNAATTEYTTDMLSQTKSFYNLWPTATNASAEVKVYGVENIAANKMNSDGEIAITATNSGHNRYAIYPANLKLDSKVKVVVKSENGESETTYYVTFARTINVTDVTLNETTKELNVGDTLELKATISPSNASITDVTWSSDNEAVASVSDTGVVTAHEFGEATITVTSVDGEKTATCVVSVNLNPKKTAAKAELAEYVDPADYRDEQKAEIEEIIDRANSAIESATNEEAIADAVAEAKAALDNVQSDEDYIKEAAKDASDKIDAIGTVSLESKAKIDLARSAYDGLGTKGKALVLNVDTLTAAESAYNALAESANEADINAGAANGVDKIIEAIGEITIDSSELIQNANDAYDTLSDEQKALVTKKDVLEAAEKEYEEITTTPRFQVLFPAENDNLNATIKENKAIVTKNKTTGVILKLNVPLDQFRNLTINEQIVDPAYYELAEGSTVITLSKNYVDSLAIGEYTVNINTEKGFGQTTISVENQVVSPDPGTPGTPATGGNSNPGNTAGNGGNSGNTSNSVGTTNGGSRATTYSGTILDAGSLTASLDSDTISDRESAPKSDAKTGNTATAQDENSLWNITNLIILVVVLAIAAGIVFGVVRAKSEKK